MHVPSIDVLLVVASPVEGRRLRALLEEGDGEYRLSWAHNVDDALRRMSHGRVDVILLDISGAGAPELDGFIAINAAAGGVPIVALAEKADAEKARAAVERGARDYLLKNHLDASALLSALRYAVELRRGAAVGRGEHAQRL